MEPLEAGTEKNFDLFFNPCLQPQEAGTEKNFYLFCNRCLQPREVGTEKIFDLFCNSCLQPREVGTEGGSTAEEKAKLVLDDVLERLPAAFDMEEIRSRVDEFSPYVMVAIQVRWPLRTFCLAAPSSPS